MSAEGRKDQFATSRSGHWARPHRRVADSTAGPAACEGQVPKQTRLPSHRPVKVRNRQPPTFAGQIRRAADSLKQPVLI